MNASKKLAVLGIATIGVVACKSISKVGKDVCEKATFTTEPKILEVHGDTVEYQTKVTIPAKVFHKKAVLKIDPVLVSGDKTSARPPVTIGGGKQRSTTKYTIDPKNGGTVTVTDRFAYDPAFQKSTLIAKNSLALEGKFQEVDQCLPSICEKKIADGIIATSQMLNVKEGDIIVSQDEYKPEEKKVSADIYYLINSATLNPRFKIGDANVDNDAQLKEFGRILSNDTVKLKGITVNSYASPDGPAANNERLAKARAEATNKFVKQRLNKAGIKEVNDSAFYHSYSITENWKGWKEEVQKSDLPDKQEILNIMNSNIDDEAKEARIKKEHAASYDKMRTTILPRLRKSEIIFGSASQLKTEAELKESGRASLDNLSQEEELQYGKIVEENDEKRRTYAHYVNKYPQDWRGYNNLAAAQLNLGEIEEAKANLDKANQLSPNNPYVLNNLGIYHALTRNYDEAIKNYSAAKSGGQVNPSYNLGVLYAKKGDYTQAIEEFNNAEKCRFNVGLTYLLNKDYENADKSLKCVPEDKKDADYYYLVAVLGARRGNFDEVIPNLKKSIEKNSNYKTIAKTDAEFYAYRNKPEFEAIFR